MAQLGALRTGTICPGSGRIVQDRTEEFLALPVARASANGMGNTLLSLRFFIQYNILITYVFIYNYLNIHMYRPPFFSVNVKLTFTNCQSLISD